MTNKQYNNTLDLLKILATILIVGSHCLPLFSNQSYNYYYGQYLFRFCVPLFFLTTGYYFTKMNNKQKVSYIVRILILYLISTVLYIPLILQAGPSIEDIIYQIVFGYGHLWYLSSLLFGLLIFYFIDNTKSTKIYFLLIPLLMVSIIFTEYYKLFDSSLLIKIHQLLTYVGTARNSLFFALPLLIVGGVIRKYNQKIFNIKNTTYLVCLIISAILSFVESYFLAGKLGYDIHLDVTAFNMFFPIILFILSFKISISLNNDKMKLMRKLCDYVYIVHLYVIYILNSIFKFTHMRLFIIATIVSFVLSITIHYIINFSKKHIKR